MMGLELSAALDDFDVRCAGNCHDIIFSNLGIHVLKQLFLQERIIMEPLAYNEVRTRPSLEERLESIISGAALMADSSCTRDERRERIVAECNAVRQALQDLLSEYMANVSCYDLPSAILYDRK